jgi:hypothetical protein
VVFNNGWQGPDRGHGHGFYIQNTVGGKYIKDNIIFQGFDLGIQAYGSDEADINNLNFQGNVFYNAGALSDRAQGSNLLLGGGRVAQNPVVMNNFTYNSLTIYSQSFNLGYEPFGAGSSNALVKDNYFARGISRFKTPMTNATITGNTFYSQNAEGLNRSEFPQNTFFPVTAFPDYPPVPTQNFISIRRNPYESNRSHIVIYNWLKSNTVSVNVSSVLNAGDSYELHNSQNYFGDVIQGTYSGGLLSIPMTGRTVAAPYGRPAPLTTFPEFGVFVLIKTSGSSVPVQTHTITATALANGSITPAGTVNVQAGTNQTFLITPNSGYKINQVVVDGAIRNFSGSVYSFSNVTAAHSISVSFVPSPSTVNSSSPNSGVDEVTNVSNTIVGKKKEARFDFTLGVSGPVKADLYTAKGEHIVELKNEFVTAGQPGRITWDGHLKNGEVAASGVYLIRIKLGDKDLTRKVVVVR